MGMLKLIDSSPLVEDAALARFNASFGNKVPPAMLAFYRSASAGYLRDEDEDTDPTGVASLIALGDDRNCIESLHRDYIQGFPHLPNTCRSPQTISGTATCCHCAMRITGTSICICWKTMS